MNCEHLRESLYEYLDDSLSPSEKAAAQRHLAECASCREAVRREQQLAHSLSSRFELAVQPLSLDPAAQRSMVAALSRKISPLPVRPPVSFWSRFALPLSAATAVLVLGIWMGRSFISGRDSTAHVQPYAAERGVVVHISYSQPQYIFQKKGSMVIDSLVSDTRVADGAMVVNNWKPEKIKIIYEN